MEASIQEIEDGIYGWSVPLSSGDKLLYLGQECRRERTGFHAQVSIAFNNAILEYDTFNIGRSEERGRLAKAAHAHLDGSLAGEEYSALTMRRDLAAFCKALPIFYEETRLVESIPDANIHEPIPPLNILLNPYIIEGAGTIIFAPPGGGKSYTGLTMAIMLGAGRSDLWPVLRARPIYWVNLERSGMSVERRLVMICRALGIEGRKHGVTFLHGRGLTLVTVQQRIKRWTKLHPDGVVFLDSISRAGQGSMVEDDTANRIIDMLNNAGKTWLALGHTSRADKDHQFGSILFDAGEDIGIKLSSEERTMGKTVVLGLSLVIAKGNDIGKGKASYIAFEFELEELWLIRGAEKGEFLKLIAEQPKSDEQRVIEYLQDTSLGTATQISAATGINRSNISTILTQGQQFVRLSRTKEGTFYGLKA